MTDELGGLGTGLHLARPADKEWHSMSAFKDVRFGAPQVSARPLPEVISGEVVGRLLTTASNNHNDYLGR